MKLYYFNVESNIKELKNYREADIMLLAKHFGSGDVDKFLAEWHRFKYDLIDFQGADYEPVTAMKRIIINNHLYFVHCKLQRFFFETALPVSETVSTTVSCRRHLLLGTCDECLAREGHFCCQTNQEKIFLI